MIQNRVASHIYFSTRFNFGSRPFKFPPDSEFRSFNSEGSLSDEQRMILPRHMRLQLQVGSVREGKRRIFTPRPITCGSNFSRDF